MVRQSSRPFLMLALMALGLGLAQVNSAAGQTRSTTAPSRAIGAGASSPSDLALGIRALGDDGQSLLIVPRKQVGAQGPFGGDAKDVFWTIVFRRGVTDTSWTPLTTVSGYPVDATLVGRQLALLMNDANWRTVYEGGSTAGEPMAVRGQRLRLLAGEEGTLFAYATGGEKPRLFRLENDAWVDLGIAPEFDRDLVADMIVREGRVVLAGLDAERRVRVYRSGVLPTVAPAAVRVRGRTRETTTEPTTTATTVPITSPATPGSSPTLSSAPSTTSSTISSPTSSPSGGAFDWEPCGQIGPLAEVAGVRLLGLGDELALWPDPSSTAGGPVYKRNAAGVWAVAFDLGSQNGELGASGGRLRFYYGDEKESKTFERVIDYAGKTLGPPIVVDDGMATKMVSQLSQMVLGLAMAGFMVGIVMSWRRRDKETPETLLAAQSLPLAPYGRRLLGGVIDNIPWLVAVAYLAWLKELTLDVSALKSLNAVVALLLAYATVVTHTTITEVIFGRTAGLMLSGLYVTDLAGKKPSPGATLIRNLFRAVDLVLLLPLLSIVVTRLRQSVGDSAAGTVVLSREAGNMPKP